jgi:hypothetical protein
MSETGHGHTLLEDWDRGIRASTKRPWASRAQLADGYDDPFAGMGPLARDNGQDDAPMNAQQGMEALLAGGRGAPKDVLVYGEIAVPAPCIGDLLVRIEAASFTPTEPGWASTGVERSGRERLPVVLGHEVSGSVTALGYGTTGLAVEGRSTGGRWCDTAAPSDIAILARAKCWSCVGKDRSSPRKWCKATTDFNLNRHTRWRRF